MIKYDKDRGIAFFMMLILVYNVAFVWYLINNTINNIMLFVLITINILISAIPYFFYFDYNISVKQLIDEIRKK